MRRVIGVFPTANAYFAQVVDARPHEIADEPGFFLRQLPELIGVKAKGFAAYAKENPGVGRIQLIRLEKDITGNPRFKRLDMTMSEVRDAVLSAINNDELDHLFDEYGFFE